MYARLIKHNFDNRLYKRLLTRHVRHYHLHLRIYINRGISINKTDKLTRLLISVQIQVTWYSHCDVLEIIPICMYVAIFKYLERMKKKYNI